ncbi:thiol-disulfide oxidoreductase DCC family protein [Dankookia sp. P2]|uniref:thiol-disulfide oxidoreductase DCC family protein n=1 Tax=Dankookia sp. P2 TaxID=3423955 RepID=UPI003D66E315
MAEPEAPLTVFYDGGCPVCTREVALYRDRIGAAGLDWVDVSRAAPEGLDQQAALARIHARLPDGRLVSGAAAFAAIWQRVPGFRWLGRLVAWAPVAPLAELGYRGFLRVRRLWR